MDNIYGQSVLLTLTRMLMTNDLLVKDVQERCVKIRL